MAVPWIAAEYSLQRIAITVTNFINVQQLCLHNFRNKVKQTKSIQNLFMIYRHWNTGSSKKMDGIWNRYNLKSTRRIYTFGILKCSEKFNVLDLH